MKTGVDFYPGWNFARWLGCEDRRRRESTVFGIKSLMTRSLNLSRIKWKVRRMKLTEKDCLECHGPEASVGGTDVVGLWKREKS